MRLLSERPNCQGFEITSKLSITVSLIAIALLGCNPEAPTTKPTDIILVPTTIPIVSVLETDDPIVRVYGDLYKQPVYESAENADLKVVNLSQKVTVFPGVISEVMDYFSELARSEQLKGRQNFVSPLNGQPLTFIVSPAKENPRLTVVILSSNVVPLTAVKMSATTYPNAFFLEEDNKSLLFVNAEGDANKDNYATIDRSLFHDSFDRINNSFYKALCSFKTVIQSSNQRLKEINNAFCHAKASALSAAQQKMPFELFSEWSRSLSVKKLLGIQDSLIPTEMEYLRTPRIFGKAIIPLKR